MGYTEVDQKAINTIRLLAVCFLSVFYPAIAPPWQQLQLRDFESNTQHRP